MDDAGQDEPGLGRTLASTGANVAGEVAKAAVTEVADAAFSFGYLIAMTGASIVILIGALAVYVGGWSVSTLALSNVPEIRGFIAPFWGVLALVFLFVGIRWVVRRFGRPMVRSAEQAVESIHQAIDERVAAGHPSEALRATESATPTPAPTSKPTLAELDARLAPQPAAPEQVV